jgi:hypothetical protein
MYEFSHSLGHSLPMYSASVPTNVRYASNSDYSKHESISDIAAIIGNERGRQLTSLFSIRGSDAIPNRTTISGGYYRELRGSIPGSKSELTVTAS